MQEFLWGAATSSHQIEGYNDKNDWWAWESQGMVEGGARSERATDHFHRYREDIGLAAELGLNSYRFSVEWSRLEPEEGQWSVEAFEWYEALIEECEKNKIIPMLTLHHFTSPLWFAKKGGFVAEDAPASFIRMVQKVITAFGDRIPLWCTFNEPLVLSVGSYLGKFMPPGEFAPKNVARSSEQMLRAHVMAYDLLHSRLVNRKGPWKDRPLEVGIAHNMMDFMPDRAWHPAERVLTWAFEKFYNQAWLDAVTGGRQHFGVPGLIPLPAQVEEARGRKTVDFIGVNYYTKAYVQWRPRGVGVVFARRKETASDLEWAIHPRGLGKLLRQVWGYGIPLYVTENGIADRDDRLRPGYLASHLKETAHAIGDGVDVRGYFHWSLLDNFEWSKGFGPRFGLYRVNYASMERTPTASAQLYRKIIERHRKQGCGEPKEDLI